MINSFLLYLIYLAPLNLFLYTWRFLAEMEQSVSKPAAKIFLKWFARISILLMPAAFYSIVTTYIVYTAVWEYNVYHLKVKEAKHYSDIS